MVRFSEFANHEHRAQADEFFLELGRFAVAFERVCEGMREAIIAIFHSEGLKHQGLSQVVIGDKASAELQLLLGALFSELRARNDDEDRKAVHALMTEVKDLTEQRNRVLHSAWRFGSNAAFAELYATATRPRAKLKSGAVPEIHGISARYLRELISKATALQVKLGRLNYCVLQQESKVAVELTKPL